MAGERILVVDDTGFNRILLEKSLGELNCEIEQAANGPEALKKLKNERFHLVITDLMMPDMDGVEFYRNARELEHSDENGEIPVPPFILCTAFHDKEVVESAVREGFKDIVLKPIDRERLLSSVKKALSESLAEISISISGEQSVVLSTLAEMVGAQPVEVLEVLLNELSIMDFGTDVDSLETLREFFHSRFSPPEE